MLIATFGPSSGAWAGTAISFASGTFSVDGYGPIKAAKILDYDRQGQVTWIDDEARGLVLMHAQAVDSAQGPSSASGEGENAQLMATLKPTSTEAGGEITREGDDLVLQGQGRISAADVMTQDRQGHLIWTSEAARRWVEAKVGTSPVMPVGTTPPAEKAPASKPPQTNDTDGSRREISAPKFFGRLLLIGGLIVFVYCIAFFDTSVPVDGYGSERINNIGLMRDQQNGIIGGIVVAVIGGVLLLVAHSRGELSSWTARRLATDERPCPFCAEHIKADAVICRYCNREVPSVGEAGTDT